jgi:urease accessory protein
MAAIRAVPLGQTAGQKILFALGAKLEKIAEETQAAPLSNFTPGLAMLSTRHETQYSRLFRS